METETSVEVPALVELRARRRSAMYQAFSRANQVIVQAKDEGALMQGICDVCVITGHALIACSLLRRDGELVLIGASGSALLLDTVEKVMKAAAETPGSPTFIALNHAEMAFRELPDGQAGTATWQGVAKRYGVREVASFPLINAAGAVGCLTVASGDGDYFDRDIMLILKEIASQAAFALENIANERERQAALDEAERSKQRFLIALEALPISAMIVDLDDNTVYEVNAAFCERYGVARERVINRSALNTGIVVPARFRQAFYALLKEGRAVRSVETTVIRPDGRTVTVRLSGRAIEYHARACALVTGIDVSDLHERERQLAGILETAQDAMITVDRQQNIMLFNAAASRIFGYPPASMIGVPARRVMPPEFFAHGPTDLVEFIADTQRNAAPDSGRRYECARSDGTRFPVRISMSKSGQGDNVLVTLILRDASAEVQAEALLAAQRDAEIASAQKTNFLSKMSHELRTPLNAVLGYAQLLESQEAGPLTTRQSSHVNAIRRAGWHLLALTNDVLDLSRLEAGVARIEPRDVERAPLRAASLWELKGSADAGTALSGTVLYVDDNAVNFYLVQTLLERWPRIRLLHASNGETGIRMARLHRPDLILLDMYLPTISGLDVLAELASSAETSTIPVFALSASATEEMAQVAKELGAVAFWTQPVDFEEFLSQLQAFFESGSFSRKAQPPYEQDRDD